MPPNDETDLTALSPEQRDALDALLATLSPGQSLLVARWVLARFDAAALAEDRLERASGLTAPSPQGLTVLYGSHSGHSAGIARQLATAARQRGWAVKLADMADYSRGTLRRERNLAVIVSTHGEGDPPESAAAFFEFLRGTRAPKLEGCEFAVLALGDKSYVKFCKAGADLDVDLERRGGKRLLARVDLDVDYQDGANVWVDAALKAFEPRMVAAPGTVAEAAQPRKARFSRDTPWSAELLHRVDLSGRGSTQHFIHLELSLDGSGLKYHPGDALGMRPENDPTLVAQLAEALGQSEQTEVDALGSCCSLAEALTRRLEIQKVSPSALRRYAGLGAKALDRILDDPEATTKYLDGRDWLDVLREHPAKIEVNQFVSLLPELASRSYSIASSQLEHADEVHLLVSRVHFTAHGRGRQGVASSYLSDRLRLGESARVWIEPNTQFRLPEDSNQPIVLIGAGTGVAPYRAFLEERAAAGQSGKNWVIFGNRQFQADFTYQTDWLRWRKDGVLTRMDVAFSRDQAQKIYVTDRMREQGRELYAWLEQGARLYLCGDRTRLAADVDRTLVEVVMTHGNQSHDEAVTYVEKLRSEKRYSKDVY